MQSTLKTNQTTMALTLSKRGQMGQGESASFGQMGQTSPILVKWARFIWAEVVKWASPSQLGVVKWANDIARVVKRASSWQLSWVKWAKTIKDWSNGPDPTRQNWPNGQQRSVNLDNWKALGRTGIH